MSADTGAMARALPILVTAAALLGCGTEAVDPLAYQEVELSGSAA